MNDVAWLAVFFLLSVYFSMIETAYTSFDRILTITWLRSKRFGARTVNFFSSRSERFLSTSLIGNNVANVAYSSLLALLAVENEVSSVWLVTASPLIVLVFAEILPKAIGFATANLAVRFCSIPLLISYYIFFPLRVLLWPFTKVIARGTTEQDLIRSAGGPFAIRRELDQVLLGAQGEGAVTPEEHQLLIRYLDAREFKVRQIMTPRTEMVAVEITTDYEEVLKVLQKYSYSVLPVYEGDMDHIIGYVRARDFLTPRNSLREILRPIPAVPESKNLGDLLQEFRDKRHQVAIVVDEYGGTDGLVTLKDIFEALVGTVSERWDPTEPVVKRIAPATYLVSGSASVLQIETATGRELADTDLVTLSGLLSERLGRIPDIGEEIVINEIRIRVIRRSATRVEGCLLRLPSRTAERDNSRLDK